MTEPRVLRNEAELEAASVWGGRPTDSERFLVESLRAAWAERDRLRMVLEVIEVHSCRNRVRADRCNAGQLAAEALAPKKEP